MRPLKSEYHQLTAAYIELVPEADLGQAFVNCTQSTLKLFSSLPLQKWTYSYAPGKWTVKELFAHIIDTERIFGYRALCFSRSEKQMLPAFDENSYVENSEAGQRDPGSLLNEYQAVRNATVELFSSFSGSQLSKTGTVPAGTISVKALGYAICGHNLHHLRVMQERYLK